MAYKLDKSALQTLFEGIRDERRLQANTATASATHSSRCCTSVLTKHQKPFSAASMTMQPRA